MAQPTTNPKIEELKARVRLDPKSRMFYPLAEELRKIGRFEEAERTLRDGLRDHGTYLSAWISLGRVLRDTSRNAEAIEVLEKASTIDPGNVVAARLMADGYLAMGAKLDALKKYKLVYALLPADPEVEALIDRLDREVNPERYPPSPPPAAVAPPDASVASSQESVPPASPEPQPEARPQEAQESEDVFGVSEPRPTATEEMPFDLSSAPDEVESSRAESPFEAASQDAARSPFARDIGDEGLPAPSADVSPLADEELSPPPSEASPFADDEPSPLDEPFPEAPEVTLQPQAPDPEPFEAADDEEAGEPAPVEDVVAQEPLPEWFNSVAPDLPQAQGDSSAEARDVTATMTMADLYARQGYVGAAREIYERLLEADPSNEALRSKLHALPPESKTREVRRKEAVQRLEEWLTRVGRREDRRV